MRNTAVLLCVLVASCRAVPLIRNQEIPDSNFLVPGKFERELQVNPGMDMIVDNGIEELRITAKPTLDTLAERRIIPLIISTGRPRTTGASARPRTYINTDSFRSSTTESPTTKITTSSTKSQLAKSTASKTTSAITTPIISTTQSSTPAIADDLLPEIEERIVVASLRDVSEFFEGRGGGIGGGLFGDAKAESYSFGFGSF